MPSAPSEHSDIMLAELCKERELGRVQGPLPLELLGSQSQAPSLQVARGFAVVQNDKVRRADDWLRSLHNSTIAAVDTPPYMGGPTVIGGALRCAEVFQEQVLLSAVDHEGAYPSLPVREPSECGLVMPRGPADADVSLRTAIWFGRFGMGVPTGRRRGLFLDHHLAVRVRGPLRRRLLLS